MADIRINALATTATTPASDDYLALDGAAQGTRKILATNIANNVSDVILGSSGPSVKSTLSARAPRQGLVFDASNAASVSNAPVFGSTPATIALMSNLAVLPASGDTMYFFGGATNCLALRVGDAGQVQAQKQNAVDYNLAGNGTIVTGKWQSVILTWDTSTLTLYVNGVSVGTAPAATTFSGASNELGASNSGSGRFNGSIIPVGYFNRCLSSSEVISLYEAGAPAGADYNAPNAMTFSSLGGTATGTANATSGNVSTTGSGHGYVNYSFPRTFSVGQKVLISFNVTAVTGQVSAYFPLNAYITPLTFSTTGVKTQTVTITTAGNAGTFDVDPSVNFTFDSFTVTPLGLLLAPDAVETGLGYEWHDQSGNGAHIALPSSGVTWNLPSTSGNYISGTTSTNGNQQLLGASVLLPANCRITSIQARSRSGTPSITIGTASGGAQLVASVALSTTWKNLTVALTDGVVSSADDVWVGSNSTDVVETRINYEALSF